MTEENSEEKNNKKEETRSEIEEMREKMKEKMQGGKGAPKMPGQMGPSSLMQRMAQMKGGGQGQTRALMEMVKNLRADMREIKDYLKRITETLEEREKE